MDLGFQTQDSNFNTWLQNFFDDDKPLANEANSDDDGNNDSSGDGEVSLLEPQMDEENLTQEYDIAETDPTREDVWKLLANDMERLDVNERGMVYEEIHGVQKLMEETPKFLTEKLADMDVALLNLSSTPSSLNASEFDADAYNQAMAIDADYKLRLYGKDALVRPLRLTDLGDDGMAYLRAGFAQLLPVRDNAGRSVFCCASSLCIRGKYPAKSVSKAWPYIMLAAAEDEETQKRGIVCVIYMLNFGKAVAVSRDMLHIVCRSLKWLPIRHTGYHVCTPDPALHSFFALVMYATPRQSRNHIRVHDGSPTECEYSMMTFGIPTGAIPVTANLKLKLDNNRKWLSRRAAKDAYIQQEQQRALLRHGDDDGDAAAPIKNAVISSSFRGIDLPGPHDVLMGRGRPYRDHSGSVRMRELVQLHQSTYDNIGDVVGQKTKVAKAIVDFIHNSEPKGRFLKIHPDHGWWVEASQAEAIEKVSQAFRTTRAALSSSSKTSSSAAAVRMVDGPKRTKMMLSAGA